MAIHSPTDAAVRLAADCLRNGQLVGLPTETVYGLAANGLDQQAVERIFAAKGRPASNPLILHVPDVAEAIQWISVETQSRISDRLTKLSTLWPGPLTVVVPRGKGIPDAVTAGGDTVAIRVPDHPVALTLLRQCEFPIAAPSANRSNYVSPTAARHVEQGMGDRVAMILDGGRCRSGLESTIVSIAGDPVALLRPGVITREQLQAVLGEPVQPPTQQVDSGPLLSPGRLPTHYQPTKPLWFVDDYPEGGDAGKVAYIAFRPDTERQAKFAQSIVLSETGDLGEIAHGLFAALRQMDESDASSLLIDRCQNDGIGAAIMDRLNRAVSAESGRGISQE
ncbi:MAG: L-threonylcarbamoyladenylate synthase [Planctomycetota bacterium]